MIGYHLGFEGRVAMRSTSRDCQKPSAKPCVTPVAFLVALLASPSLASVKTSSPETRRADGKGQQNPPRFLFNCDGGSCSISAFRPPITTDQLTRPVDELRGTSVDVFIHCINRGGDTYAHPTRVGEVYGQRPIDWSRYALGKSHVGGLRNQAGNIRALLEAGKDPIRILEARTHELRMQFWLSMRMNEQHEDDVKRFGSKLSEFKKANRHLLIGKDFAKGVGAYCDKYGYTWTWDYARREVRDRQLAVLVELLETYHLDGLELDFCRGPWYFKDGRAQAGMPLMTEFVRRVRSAGDRVAAVKDRRITLAVRVRPSFEQNERLGLDVRRWIKEELVDLVTPMDPGYFDMGADLRSFVEAARGTAVSIAGGIEPNTRGYGRNSPAQQFAAASAFFDQGADAVYLFNFDCHRRRGRQNAYTPAEIDTLKRLDRPETYRHHNKHYFVTRDPRGRLAGAGGTMPLPARLTVTDSSREFTIYVGDDLAGAREAGAVEDVRLRLGLDGHPPDGHGLKVWINGELLDNARRKVAENGRRLAYHAVPARRGRNVVRIALIERPPQAGRPLRVETLELLIDYAPASSKSRPH